MKLQCWGFVGRMLFVGLILGCISVASYAISEWLWIAPAILATCFLIISTLVLIHAFLCELQNWLLNGSKR